MAFTHNTTLFPSYFSPSHRLDHIFFTLSKRMTSPHQSLAISTILLGETCPAIRTIPAAAAGLHLSGTGNSKNFGTTTTAAATAAGGSSLGAW